MSENGSIVTLKQRKNVDALVKIFGTVPGRDNTPTVISVKMVGAVTADLLGASPSRFPAKGPVPLTRRNIGKLGGLRPRITGSIPDLLSGRANSKIDYAVTFSESTAYWAVTIVESVPTLKAVATILSALEESKRDPEVRRNVIGWLAEYLRPAQLATTENEDIGNPRDRDND
jgi:hypothetical protein